MSSKEIERKFLPKNQNWEKENIFETLSIRQIYFKAKDGYRSFFKKVADRVELHLLRDEKEFGVELLSVENSLAVIAEPTIQFDDDGVFPLDENAGWAVRMRKSSVLCDLSISPICEFTVKGKSVGISRPEFNIETENDGLVSMIFLNYDSEEMPYISKVRYMIRHDEKTVFEIDEFKKPKHMNGVVLIEIELPDENYPIRHKDWIGEEVSTDPKYFNSNLI